MLADRIRMCSCKGKRLIDRTTPTLVVDQPYSTEGNGGRKLVRLDNGWLVTGVKEPERVKVYISKNNGTTFSQFYSIGAFSNVQDFSIATDGAMTHVIVAYNNSTIRRWSIAQNGSSTISNIDSAQTVLGNCSLTVNEDKTELHACWSSKNSTYPNNFNIRYCKGTINADGSVTWGNVEQVTTFNDSGGYIGYENPSIVLNSDNRPVILTSLHSNDNSRHIQARRFSGTVWVNRIVYMSYRSEGAYLQLYPSACVDKDGVIHVVWNRQTDSSTYYIAYSKSIDGGVTWTEPSNIRVSDSNSKPSIAVNNKNHIFVEHARARNTVVTYYSKDNGATWVLKIIYTSELEPSLLDDNILDFESPLGIYMTTTNHEIYPNSVVFRGKWYE